jgi:acyl carrier protein
MMNTDALTEEIRVIVGVHGRLGPSTEQLGDEVDLFVAGMTSHASVNVMLALEGKLGVEFPDRMLNRGVFASISSIRAAVLDLRSSLRRTS